jgi:uncharacterized protein (TIGR02231 family)
MQHQPIVFSIIMVAFLAGSAYAAQAHPKPIPAQSRITEVTVYTDRAQVIRTASLQVTPGEQVIRLSGLPEAIDQNSVQVSGLGNASIRDVSFKREHFAQTQDQDRKKIQDKIQACTDSLNIFDDQRGQIAAQRLFLEGIVKKLTATSEKESAVLELEPEKWIKMVTFQRDKISDLDRESRKIETASRLINAELEKIRRDLDELAGREQKTENIVDVTIESKSDAAVSLELAYIVYGPGWTPTYDLRVSGNAKSMQITYNAKVRQSTGEEWENVAVKLSTAQVAQSGTQPELSPWHLDIFRPRQEESSYANKIPYNKKSLAAPAVNQYEMEKVLPGEDLQMLRSAPMIVATAAVETRATSVVYKVAGTSTIASDNTDYRLTIAVIDLPVSLRYSSVPKLSPFAYLKAKATNTSDYALLPGPSNIFFDNQFVAQSQLDLVSPTAEFWTSLGIDEGIQVERKTVKRQERSGGVFGKKTHIDFEYQIVTKNNKKSAEEIVIWDQTPVSSNEQIIVTLVEPANLKDTTVVKMNEYKYLEWRVKLNPGQETKVPFRYSVEYPSDARIEGLE